MNIQNLVSFTEWCMLLCNEPEIAIFALVIFACLCVVRWAIEDLCAQ